MEASATKAADCYGNVRGNISKQSPRGERADHRQVSYNSYGKQGDEVFETGSVRSTKPYACADCRYATDRKNNLRRHRATMHERCERALECCGLTFVSKSELREHVSANHGSGAGYACAECGRRFGRRALMRRHAAVHDGRPPTDEQRRRSKGVASISRRYACHECDYTTEHRSNLDRHVRRHAGLHPTTATYTGDSRYLPLTTNRSDDHQPAALSVVDHRDLNVERNGCCCHMCLSTLYDRHKLPFCSPSTLSSSQAPFMFNLLPPRLEDVAWSFRKSLLPDFNRRRLWSLNTEDHKPSTATSRDTSNVVGDQSTSKDTASSQMRIVDGPRNDGLGDRLTSSTCSTEQNAHDEATNDFTSTCHQQRLRIDTPPLLHRCVSNEQPRVVGDGLYRDGPDDRSSTGDVAADSATTSDVTGTCPHRPARRLRLLPLLHTCRSCSLTFASQLQLKSHSDLFHRATDLDIAAARPICYRVKTVNQPEVRPS